MNSIKRRLFALALVAVAAFAAKDAASQTLLAESFSYSDGVITSEKAFYSGICPCSSLWDMTSGTLFASSGRGWSGAPNTTNNSAVFRMKTKAKTYQNVAMTFRLLNQGLTTTSRTPAQSYDGVHVWLRYGAEEGPMYALSINRRDGVALIKKKLPGGATNGGTYATIGQTKSYPVRYGQWVNVRATALNNSDGSVTLELFADGVKLLSVRDASSPIRGAGAIGVRGDNCNFMIDDLAVTTLGGTTTTSPTAAAPVTSAVSVTNLATTGATVLWKTDLVSHSQVEYGLTSSFGAKSYQSTATGLDHSMALTGLQSGKTYYFRTLSKDPKTGLTGVSGTLTFVTKSAATAPLTSAVSVTNLTTSGATVLWKTDKVSHSQVEYGLSASFGSKTGMSTATGLDHSMALSGLQSGKTYYFRALSKDGATGLTGASSAFTFVTKTAAATGPLASAVQATGITASAASINWNTDKVSHSQVEYGLTTAYGSKTGMSTATGLYHTMGLTGLQSAKTYYYRVLSKDDATGLTGVSAGYTLTTTGAVPAPTPSAVIYNVAAAGITSTGATINWTTTTNSHSQVEYGVTTAYGQQTAQSTATGLYHSMPLAALKAGTTYNYRVKSLDKATGRMDVSGNFTFRTSGTATATAK